MRGTLEMEFQHLVNAHIRSVHCTVQNTRTLVVNVL